MLITQNDMQYKIKEESMYIDTFKEEILWDLFGVIINLYGNKRLKIDLIEYCVCTMQRGYRLLIENKGQ